MPDDSALCEHVRPGDWPLRADLVLDDHLGPTDALMSCRLCGRVYLLEMLDWRGRERVMRMSLLAPEHAAGLIHDLGRGSCDAARAAAEIDHARSRARPLPWLLRLDAGGPTILGLAPLPPDTRLPSVSWRELPCDGRWVDYARSNTAIVNG
ncbi:MAG: hypothetical protein RIC56_06895 [Pseudomonadales bacterium]